MVDALITGEEGSEEARECREAVVGGWAVGCHSWADLGVWEGEGVSKHVCAEVKGKGTSLPVAEWVGFAYVCICSGERRAPDLLCLYVWVARMEQVCMHRCFCIRRYVCSSGPGGRVCACVVSMCETGGVYW